MKKIFGWTAVGLMSLGAFAACSSDKKSPTTTKADTATTVADGGDTATTTGGGDTATTTGGGSDSGANAEVTKFCNDVADLIAKGPTDSGYASNLQALIAQGGTLAASVANDPAAQQQLTECVTKLSTGG